MRETNKTILTGQKLNSKEVEKALAEISPGLMKKLNNKEQMELTSFVLAVQKSHSGPLPTPETLAAYARIIENGAERIMQMAENQQKHRMEVERRLVLGRLRQTNMGQTYAFIIALVFIISSVVCAFYGHELIAGILGVGGLSGIVSAFIKGRAYRKSKEEVNRKNPG